MSIPSVLQEIVASRRAELEQLSQHYQAEQLQAQLQPSSRSLAAALAQPRASFILECKRASPSKGLIRPDFNPVSLAQTYARYADAISVLTEPNYFQGSYAYLAAVSQAVDKPVLCKDFIIDPLQVLLARYFGADAILLMLSILDDQQYQALAELAAKYQLDVLTEVANEAELTRAINLKAKIIGINNRDLHTLKIDTDTSLELSQQIPAGVLVVAESGYHTNQQVRAAAGVVDGFLVGSALAAQANVDQACRELVYGEHKICGLQRPEDSLCVHAAGAAFGGLIFVKHSPRCVDLAQAQAVIAAAPLLAYVGVFADQPLHEVAELTQQLNLHAVQLHGQEDFDYISQLRKAIPRNVQIWKAVAVDEPLLLPDLEVDTFLLDNRYGGSGEPFDWSLLAHLTPVQRQQCMIAGGLNATNVSAALATGLPRCDINSGVELYKAHKDPALINQVMTQLRGYGRIQQGVNHD